MQSSSSNFFRLGAALASQLPSRRGCKPIFSLGHVEGWLLQYQEDIHIWPLPVLVLIKTRHDQERPARLEDISAPGDQLPDSHLKPDWSCLTHSFPRADQAREKVLKNYVKQASPDAQLRN